MNPTPNDTAEPLRSERAPDGTTFKVDTSRPAGPVRERLTPNAVHMVAVLRPKASVLQTATLFPHVVNRLARVVADPPVMLRLLDELILDDRPNREGFPFQVLMELTRLREVFQDEARRRPQRG